MNAYKVHLSLDSIRELCREHGEVCSFRKGERLVVQGEVCRKIGYIEKGYFHYIQAGSMGNFITGFAFANEFVADYPRCLYGLPSDVSIVCASAAKVSLIDAAILSEYWGQSIENERMGRMVMEQVFLQTYGQLHALYTQTPEERYRSLLARHPLVVQKISLKELASYLRVTPTTISMIRRKITFGEA